jgi:DHA2 family multidrug resistance protein-like MFS transporter
VAWRRGRVTPGTAVILGEAPEEKAGAASAISETATDLGGAFGVVVLGSVGAAVYRRILEIPASLPAGMDDASRDTLGAAATLSADLADPLGRSLLSAAQEAFIFSLQIAAAAGSAIVLASIIAFSRSVVRRPVAS